MVLSRHNACAFLGMQVVENMVRWCFLKVACVNVTQLRRSIDNGTLVLYNVVKYQINAISNLEATMDFL
jgi:hypothetical protein